MDPIELYQRLKLIEISFQKLELPEKQWFADFFNAYPDYKNTRSFTNFETYRAIEIAEFNEKQDAYLERKQSLRRLIAPDGEKDGVFLTLEAQMGINEEFARSVNDLVQSNILESTIDTLYNQLITSQPEMTLPDDVKALDITTVSDALRNNKNRGEPIPPEIVTTYATYVALLTRLRKELLPESSSYTLEYGLTELNDFRQTANGEIYTFACLKDTLPGISMTNDGLFRIVASSPMDAYTTFATVLQRGDLPKDLPAVLEMLGTREFKRFPIQLTASELTSVGSGDSSISYPYQTYTRSAVLPFERNSPEGKALMFAEQSGLIALESRENLSVSWLNTNDGKSRFQRRDHTYVRCAEVVDLLTAKYRS